MTESVIVTTEQSTLLTEKESVTVIVSETQGPPGIAGQRGEDGIPGPKGDGIDKVFYVRDTPVPLSVGGVSAGTTFNLTYEEVLDAILYPYMKPAFQSFTVSPSKLYEVGEKTPAQLTFSWSASYATNIAENSVEISGVASWLEKSGSYLFETTPVGLNDAGLLTWSIRGFNTKSEQFARDVSLRWAWRLHYGESELTSLSESDVKSLRVSQLSMTSSGNYQFQETGYKYISYPASYGVKTKFKDTDTGLDVAMAQPYSVAVTNQFGITQEYIVHRTLNKLGGAITIAVS